MNCGEQGPRVLQGRRPGQRPHAGPTQNPAPAVLPAPQPRPQPQGMPGAESQVYLGRSTSGFTHSTARGRLFTDLGNDPAPSSVTPHTCPASPPSPAPSPPVPELGAWTRRSWERGRGLGAGQSTSAGPGGFAGGLRVGVYRPGSRRSRPRRRNSESNIPNPVLARVGGRGELEKTG